MFSRRPRSSGESSTSRMRSGLPGAPFLRVAPLAPGLKPAEEEDVEVVGCCCMTSSMSPGGDYLLDEVIPQCIRGDVGIALHGHLLEDAASVGADRFYRQE